jgi:hypothetical protein
MKRRAREPSVVRAEPARKKRIRPRMLPDLIVGDPDDLVHIEWPWNQTLAV